MHTPRVTERDNFLWLLAALVFLLFSGAFFAQIDFPQGQRAVNITLMGTMLIAVWSLERDQKKWLSPKIGMSLVIALVMVGDSIMSSNMLATTQLVVALTFLSLTTLLAWRQVMFTGNIDRNKIIGAICIYMLLGIVWAFGYLLIEQIFPGSMNGLDHDLWQHNLEDIIYYSMVTLTTLGYGDITPEAPLARFMAYMESITGIFYTTILVASLIGIRLANFQIGHADEAKKDSDEEQV